MVPLGMFEKARRLPHRLPHQCGLEHARENYNITVNIRHLNRQLGIFLNPPASLLETASLSGTVKMKIPGLVAKYYLSGVFKKTR